MKRQRRSVKHLYATSIPHTRKVRRLLMSLDTSSFVKRSLTMRLYHQPLTACDSTSTEQTTRRTFGEKASMPYSSSHPPKEEDDELTSKLMSKDPAPTSLLVLTTCTCKKKECSSNCSCVNVGLSCTEARACMAEDTCKNPHGVEWELEDSYFDDEE